MNFALFVEDASIHFIHACFYKEKSKLLILNARNLDYSILYMLAQCAAAMPSIYREHWLQANHISIQYVFIACNQ